MTEEEKKVLKGLRQDLFSIINLYEELKEMGYTRADMSKAIEKMIKEGIIDVEARCDQYYSIPEDD